MGGAGARGGGSAGVRHAGSGGGRRQEDDADLSRIHGADRSDPQHLDPAEDIRLYRRSRTRRTERTSRRATCSTRSIRATCRPRSIRSRRRRSATRRRSNMRAPISIAARRWSATASWRRTPTTSARARRDRRRRCSPWTRPRIRTAELNLGYTADPCAVRRTARPQPGVRRNARQSRRHGAQHAGAARARSTSPSTRARPILREIEKAKAAGKVDGRGSRSAGDRGTPHRRADLPRQLRRSRDRHHHRARDHRESRSLASCPANMCTCRISLHEIPNALLVPQAAIGSSQLGKYVYVVGPESKVEQRLVSLGPTDGDVVVVAKRRLRGRQDHHRQSPEDRPRRAGQAATRSEGGCRSPLRPAPVSFPSPPFCGEGRVFSASASFRPLPSRADGQPINQLQFTSAQLKMSPAVRRERRRQRRLLSLPSKFPIALGCLVARRLRRGHRSAVVDRARSGGLRSKAETSLQLGHCQAMLLYIDINDACNLKCTTCPRGVRAFPNTSKKMSLSMFRRIVEKGRHDGAYQVGLFNWVEPFLIDDLSEYTKIVKQFDLRCEVASTLSVRRINGLIPCLRFVDMLWVTISGYDQSTYEVNHHGGNVEYVLEHLRTISEAKKDGEIRSDILIRFLRFRLQCSRRG